MKLVKFETAKLAKEKGFGKLCYWYYTNDKKLHEPWLENGSSTDVEFRVDLTDLEENYNYMNCCISAPTQSQLQQWLREEHELYVSVDIYTPESPGTFFLIPQIKSTRNSFLKYRKELIEFNETQKNYTWNGEGGETYCADVSGDYELALEEVLQQALNLIK